MLKIDDAGVTVGQKPKPPIIIPREDVLQATQGAALLFSAISSWADVIAAPVYKHHEALVLKLKNGKVAKGWPMGRTGDSITLKRGSSFAKFTKDEILTVDYLRVRPSSDTWDYFATESPEILFLFPETYYRLAGFEGTLHVRLYDASMPQGLPQKPCPTIAPHQ